MMIRPYNARMIRPTPTWTPGFEGTGMRRVSLNVEASAPWAFLVVKGWWAMPDRQHSSDKNHECCMIPQNRSVCAKT